MSFTSISFICFFFVVLFLYYICPLKFQKWILLFASYVFYAVASPKYLIFLLVVTLVTYFSALGISKVQLQGRKNLILFFCVVILLSLLGTLKYLPVYGFSILSTIILPVGLSFYIFQSLGYVIDVHREMVDPEKNLGNYALFVSYFPQLLQGPIGSFSTLSEQLLSPHKFNYDEAKKGLQRAVWGFFKKLVIANRISLVIGGIWHSNFQYHGLTVFLVLVLYSIQLYADFSGYMDIAIGCSQSLGIKLDENFKVPYFSKTIAEFWRNWHITLGAWFRNYVFYSLQRTKFFTKTRLKLKKKSKYLSATIPNVMALVITWFLIGLWHGASFNYVLYGLFHGFFVILATVIQPLTDKFYKRFTWLKTNKIWTAVQVARTFTIVTFGYILFCTGGVGVAKEVLRNFTSELGFKECLHFCSENFFDLLMAFLGFVVLFFVDLFHLRNPDLSIRVKIDSLSVAKQWIIYIFALLAILFMGSYGTTNANQFAYFRF